MGEGQLRWINGGQPELAVSVHAAHDDLLRQPHCAPEGAAQLIAAQQAGGDAAFQPVQGGIIRRAQQIGGAGQREQISLRGVQQRRVRLIVLVTGGIQHVVPHVLIVEP